jgi:hypothetical protein
MSLMSERQKPHHVQMPAICWRCDAPIKIKTITPPVTASLLDEIVYSYPGCHDENNADRTEGLVIPLDSALYRMAS